MAGVVFMSQPVYMAPSSSSRSDAVASRRVSRSAAVQSATGLSARADRPRRRSPCCRSCASPTWPRRGPRPPSSPRPCRRNSRGGGRRSRACRTRGPDETMWISPRSLARRASSATSTPAPRGRGHGLAACSATVGVLTQSSVGALRRAAARADSACLVCYGAAFEVAMPRARLVVRVNALLHCCARVSCACSATTTDLLQRVVAVYRHSRSSSLFACSCRTATTAGEPVQKLVTCEAGRGRRLSSAASARRRPVSIEVRVEPGYSPLGCQRRKLLRLHMQRR